ncbi:Abi-alpha family protein [Aequorivita capsosiphonis]|uniref:Abi-alpha family protein n=1 Tax=Aequorivita capsosiphonis TaxID=487317 RepID=UPI0003F8A9FF|nr:Abi-alpha family protein [Aequorivita capsosiphonis]
MKEIIEGLNLPKQILDKTEKFMSKLLGPSIKEFGELFADNVRFRRLKNQVKIFNKTRELLDKNGLEPRELNLKTLVPLVEKSSVEDDEFLQDKWANLISNIATTAESGLEPRLINTLSSLSSLEAKILDYVYEDLDVQRQLKLAKLLDSKHKKYTQADIKIEEILIDFESIKNAFELSEEFTKIYIDNLESLGLLRYEEPQIDIDNGSTSADFENDENDEDDPRIDLNLDLTANYMGSDDFHLTAFGNYFIKQCKSE